MASYTDDPLEGFVNRLDAVCRKRGLNPTQASRACGIAHKTFCDIYAGETRPSIKSLMAICEGLGVSADYLLWGNRK